ncbi:DMT family transporter [Sagittula sp. MA-2]|jgi:drug/metabolite transporter (DMT)-like permease|uniref:DMT family transporter n=1 Tax=Sagittula sp. MA-2 TaxID=3048007 RepID=UPI0024C40A0F|nr:DMT family transporter [Sagittula sp. MA-2]WHZ33898.1 DMT family transporter [Sagittula sp. MA-2]
MSSDRPLLGIGLMLAFCLLAPFGDALAKLLGPHLSVGQITTLRFAAQAIVLVPLSIALRRSWRMSAATFGLLFLRTLMHIAGIALVVTSLLYLPLADAIAIAYVMPFIALLLGHLFLGETVGPHRLAACVAGFGGTLLVLQPAFADVGAPALIPLGVALVFSIYMLLSRQLGSRLDPIAQQAAAAPIALAILVPLMALTPESMTQTTWIDPTPQLWGLIALMGLVGSTAHLTMSWALKYAPASTLAPMQYLEIPFAAFVGYLIWGDLLGPLATLGVAITIASGLYVVMRERATAARAPAPKPVHSGAPPTG